MSLTHRELEIERDLAVDQPAAEMLAVVDKALARVAALEELNANLKRWQDIARPQLEARVADLEAELAKERDDDDQFDQRLVAAHKAGYELGLDQSGEGES